MARNRSRTGTEAVGHGIELVDPDAPAGAGAEARDVPAAGEGPRHSSALIATAALVVAVAVGALLVSQGETPPPLGLDDPSTTEPDDGADLDDDDEESVHPVDVAFRGATRVTLSPIEVDRLTREPDLLVAPTPSGYVVIDAVAETAARIDIGGTPVALAPAWPGEMFAHGEDSSVAIVSIGERDVELMAFDVDYFAPSADRAKVWLRFGTIPNRIVELDRRFVQHEAVTRGDDPLIDARFRIGDGGEILDLTRPDGERQIELPGEVDVVGVDTVGLIGRECRSGVCALSRVPADAVDEPTWWDGTRIRHAPDTIDRVVVSSDGQWLVLVGDDELSVQNEGGLVAVLGAGSPQFSADGAFLYVLGPETFTVFDLESAVAQTTALPPGLYEAMDGWIVVERSTE